MQAGTTTPRIDADGDIIRDEDGHYALVREYIRRHARGHAYRALETAAQIYSESTVARDLASVCIIRGSLARFARWPRDGNAHLDLGRAYFDLDLGDKAVTELVLVQRLWPQRHEGFVLATLEYLYRREYAFAALSWARARERNSALPPGDELTESLSLA